MAEPTMEEGILVNVEGALQPCDICGRTFLPAPLTKHMRVCERNATRKRKVFDSLKQRVEGTELAQFHQRTYLKRQPTSTTTPEANRQSSKWREKHLELVNTIREARGLPIEMPSSPRRTPSNSAAGSERCPSCDRQFGPRAFDRHVEWCKQQRSRVQRSPAEVLLAKERLEARTKYRVPAPRSKRTLIREKYSPTLGNRTESVNSIKSVSCLNLERSPSIRKQRSVLNTKTEREPIKFEHHTDAIAELQTKYEEIIPKQQAKEKCVPKERKIPVIEGIKSSHLPRQIPRSKINTTEINSGFEGITVSHMKIGPGNMKESRRMVTWKDTVRNATPTIVAGLNSTLLKKSVVNNKKTIHNTNAAKKIADNQIKSLKLRNESNDIVTNKKNLSEAQIKQNKKCTKINLTIDADCCSLDSSRSINETTDETGFKHTSKKISFKSWNEVTDNLENNDEQLNLYNKSKNSPHYLKSKLQEMNQNREALETEDGNSKNNMTTKLKVPFSISKYRKTKVLSDKNMKTMEQNLQFPLESNNCPTIMEYDEEEELDTKNDIFESNFVSESNNKVNMNEYVSTNPKIESPKGFSSSSITLSSHIDIVNEVFSTSRDSLENVNEPLTEDQQDYGITGNNSLLLEDLDNISTQLTMYDSHKWKNSDIISTVQDICSKEKHCLNTEFNGNSEQLENSYKYIHNNTHIKGYENFKDGNMKINGDFENISFFGKNESLLTTNNDKIIETVVLPEGGEQTVTKQNLQMGYDLSKKNNVTEIRQSFDRNAERDCYETATISKACEIGKKGNLEAGCSFKDTTILGTNKNKLSLKRGNNSNIIKIETIEGNGEEKININKSYEDVTMKSQSLENEVMSNLGKPIPCSFRLKSENDDNQNSNIRNIDVASMSVETFTAFSEQGKCIRDDGIKKSLESNNMDVIDTIDDTYVTSNKCNEIDFDSLECCNKNTISNDNTALDEHIKTFDTFSCPQKYNKRHIEENYDSINNISKTDIISILHKPSHKVAEIESLECINIDAWNEALSMARVELSVRKCCSAVCLNPHKSQENCFATFTELDLAKFTSDETTLQGYCIQFQYQTDDVFIEREHIEVQSSHEVDEWTSDQILEIAGDQFIASYKGDGDGLASARSSGNSLDCIPLKRRKLNSGDFITSTNSSFECSSIGSTLNTIIFEHNLIKNLEKIKSRKKKIEHELDVCEVVRADEGFDNFQNEFFENDETLSNREKTLQGGNHDLVNKYTNTENDTQRYTSGIRSNRYYTKESKHELVKNYEEEKVVNSPVRTWLMKNENNYKLETNYNTPTSATTSSSVLHNISPRLLDIITSVIGEDDCRASNKDYEKEDMLVISKQHCKNLLELDLHILDLPSKTKLPQIELKHVNISSNKQKIDDVELTEFTLPPITSASGCASKIPVARSSLGHKGNSSSLCSKEPVSLLTFPKLNSASDKQSDYNPFVTAERQLMELLECDDFKPYFRNKSPSTQHLQRPHTTTNTKSKLTDIHKNNKVVKSAENAPRKSNIKLGPNSKRSSVIEPPMDFQDNLNVLSDDFELIERLINQNYADGYDINNDLNDINFDSISNKIAKSLFLHSDANENNNSALTRKERKYSDDMSSIDPRLINENDNLSIPENLKIDDNSSNSSNDNVTPLISNLHKENYESKRAPKITTTEKINRSLDQHNSVAIKKSKQISDNKRSIKPLKQATKGAHKSTASLTSSYGSTRNNLSTDKKRNLSSLKRSVSLVDPVKPKNLKNKQDVENYFDEQDRKNAIKAERTSPDRQLVHRASPERQVRSKTSPDQQELKSQKSENNSNIFDTSTAEELFSVDDEMYEEYKKYEEMYLREKQQNIQNEKKPEELVSSGTLTPNEGSDNVPTNAKLSADSAYSRNTPKIRARSTKLAPLDCQGSQSSPLGSPNSSGSEASPTFLKHSAASQRMSKFCHECGNKYPINTAKFCVECGVRRLVL